LPTIQSHFRGNKDVFKRSLDELSQESVSTVLELIAQKSLYKGEEWEAVLKQFQKIQKQYMKLEDLKKDLFCWEQSVKVGPVISKIRNHSIGTLLIDITEGMELDEAVKRYEAIVAPSNYKRPKAIFTKKMLEDAQKQLEELGFMNSLGRRFAVIDDITINNIIYANKTSINKIQNNIFEELSNEVAVNPKNFNKVEEIAIEDFITKVIPTTQNIEVFMENKFKGNLVSLIAPKVKDSKTMFKWNNNFSWAYKGNITDSMKERVKDFGGDVEGVLRFSIQWNTCGDNQDDLDAHCKEPNGYHIYYGSKNNRNTTGKLDVDIRHPKTETQDGVAVENITWSNQNKMLEGTYKFYVHNYAKRGSRSGFTAEIEFDGQIHSFSYNTALRDQERIEVAEVIYSKKEGFKLIEKLPSTTSTQKVWNINTMQFHPVSVMMYSPNYWDEQQGIGHKHYFFMIDDCINDESPNGFFNEYLKEDLMKHKRVFEALGSKTKVEDSDNQLSGIGFSSTKRDSVICKVQGNTNRLLKIKF
jgi:hypothetical protein